MVVHTYDTGHDRVTPQVEYRDTVARGLICAGFDGVYLTALDVDVLIRDRRGTCSIDDLDVLKDYFGRANAQVLAHLRPESIRALGIGKRGVRQGGPGKDEYRQQRKDPCLFH